MANIRKWLGVMGGLVSCGLDWMGVCVCVWGGGDGKGREGLGSRRRRRYDTMCGCGGGGFLPNCSIIRRGRRSWLVYFRGRERKQNNH